MKKSYVIGLCGVLVVSLVAVIVLCCMRSKLHNDHQELEEQFTTTLNEIEEAPDEITYVEVEPDKYITEELTKESVLEVINQTGLSDETLNVVATVFTLLNPDFTDWAIDYNRGYCDVFKLYSEESDVTVTVSCYSSDYAVAKKSDEDTHIYTHGDVLISLEDKIVEALSYLLAKYDTWDWNMSESALVAGQLQEKYPTAAYNVTQDGIILDNGVTVAVSGGVLQYNIPGSDTGELYAMYPRMVTTVTASDLVDTSNWAPIENLNIVTIIEILEEQELPVPEDGLVDIFSKDPVTSISSWTYDIDDSNVLTVSAVELNDLYAEGFMKSPLFRINLDTGEHSRYY